MRKKTIEEFPIDTFRGCVGHIGDGSTLESPNGYRSSTKLCADYGITYDQACTLAYGSDPELLTKVSSLEAELAQREHDLAVLVDDYEAKLNEKHDKAPDHRMGVLEFMGYTWRYPQTRLMLLTCIVGLVMRFHADSRISLFGGVLLVITIAWSFLLWSTAMHFFEGYGPLLVKTLLLCLGLAIAWASPDLDRGFAILAGVSLVLAFRLIENVMKRLGEVRFIHAFMSYLL